jgi:protein ImuB
MIDRGMTDDPQGAAVRTLVVWCPDWPLVAAGIPAEVPAATFHANRVVACTAAAREEGVCRGLRRREAQSYCPGLVVEAQDLSRDARAFEPVVAALEQFAPRLEVTRPGACALATRGPSRYFGGDEALAARIQRTVQEVLLTLPAGAGAAVACRVGVADGPFAAALAARQGLVVPVGESAAFVAPFLVSVLDQPDLTGLLVRLGLRTLGAFAALPAADVVARFGAGGSVAHRRARGLDGRSLDAALPSPDLTTTVELDPPADRVDTAAFAAKAIADRLCEVLAAMGMVCTCIRIESETEHGELLSRVWRHHQAFSPGTVAERVRWQLDGWLTQGAACGCPAPAPGSTARPCPGGSACPDPVGGTSGGLTLLRLVPEEVIYDDGRQLGFWGGSTAADERAARALARIQGMLGPEAVVTAVLQGGRGPGEQVRLIPWGEPREPPHPRTPVQQKATPGGRTSVPGPMAVAAPAGKRRRSAGRSPSPSEVPVWPGRIPPPAPALVHREPVAVELVDEGGQPIGVSGRGVLTGVPDRLSVTGGPWTAITSWAGPWPADERWWDSGAHRRRARLQVSVAGGGAHLLTLESGTWWVEATYD